MADCNTVPAGRFAVSLPFRHVAGSGPLPAPGTVVASLLDAFRRLPPDTATELSALAERLADLAPNRRIDWSDAWSDEARRPSRRPRDQSPAGRCDRKRHLPGRAPRRAGWNPHHEVAQGAGHNRSHPLGLAICRTPRRILLPSIRVDGPSFGISRDRPPQRTRLGVRQGASARSVCQLARLRLERYS